MNSGTRSARHVELAHFLTTRRTRLLPETCGLPAFRARRRTPGLRREDVSAIAGISTAYYTWIEQGRIFDISVEVLSALASALRLNEIETSHLYTLAGKADPGPPACDEARTPLAAIGLVEDAPAFALTPWLDVVEANRAARHFFELKPGMNLASWLFAPTGESIVSIHGNKIAASLVALLRRNRARDVGNEHFGDVVPPLYASSKVFRMLWDAHVVDLPALYDIEIEHRLLGRRCFSGTLLSEPIASRWFVLLMAPSPP